MLAVSEQFYSIQGEGEYIGVPSIFLRLQGCNLTCGGVEIIKTGKRDNTATWRCDTIDVWTKGNKKSCEYIIQEWKYLGWIHALKKGAHLIVTGGEPLLQQNELSMFLKELTEFCNTPLFVECETNGTIKPSSSLDFYVNRYNVSPKISNSGMTKQQCIIKDALNFFARSQKSIFKCVVSSLVDITEYQKHILDPFSVPSIQTYIMPAADSRVELYTLESELVNWAKQFHYRYSTRLHIAIWDKKTGV